MDTIQITDTTRLRIEQDTDAEDPRTWDTSVDVIAYNVPWGSLADDMGDCRTKLGTVFTIVYGNTGDDDLALKVARRYASVFGIDEQIDTRTVHGHTQSEWADVVAAVPEGYGTPEGHLDTFQSWFAGDVFGVILERGHNLYRLDDEGVPFDEPSKVQWEEVESIWGCYLDDTYTAQVVAKEYFDLTDDEEAACAPPASH